MTIHWAQMGQIVGVFGIIVMLMADIAALVVGISQLVDLTVYGQRRYLWRALAAFGVFTLLTITLIGFASGAIVLGQ